jgi:hypothetical protein
MTFLRRLLCLHEWAVDKAEDHEGTGTFTGKKIHFTVITCKCRRCGKTSIHKIQ